MKEEFLAGQSVAKKSVSTRTWIIGAVIVILGCCCLAAAGGGFIYLFVQDQSWQDRFSSDLLEPPDMQASPVNTAFPKSIPLVSTPDAQEIPTVEAAPQAGASDSQESADQLLVITGQGLWTVNAGTGEAVQISYDPLNAPDDLNEGLSPDGKVFGYITGFGGASLNPMLVVLDLEKNTSLLQLELSGPATQPHPGSTHGDPAFEAFGAMRFSDSLAWSPDGRQLAFVAARDGDSADVYLYHRDDNSVTRLTDEAGQASALHWSPDGQLLQYVSVNTFGTGAGANMNGLWFYDFQTHQAQLLQTLESNGENFLTWVDDQRFLIYSWSRFCESYDLRIVDTAQSGQQVIVDGCFTDAEYDAEGAFGMFSATEFNYENCSCGEPLDAGLRIFGNSVPLIQENGHKKFEEIIAYDIGFIPEGQLFTVYGDEGLQKIYYDQIYSLDILPEVKGLTPQPSPAGAYWAWASRVKTGLWITENNDNPVEVSLLFSGLPIWSQNGQILYFFEDNQIFSADAPPFRRELLAEIPGQDILGLIKSGQ